jgi:alpha-L-fucosidase
MNRITILFCVVLLMTGAYTISAEAGENSAGSEGQYKADWESLSKHSVPEWFKDAKFGIYTHWGVYTVPAFGTEWYPRNMYIEGSAEFRHHRQTYGDQSKFGYKDFIPMFKAEKFNADEWAELFEQAGAKFAGPVAEHHDGFSMWKSKVNRWNAGDMGPKRDVTGELVKALRKRNMKIITSFHHAFNIQGYYTARDDWDTNDPEYGDLYGKFSDQKVAHDRWLAKIKEVIDNYQPDQIWFDFCLEKIPDEYKKEMAAYYYNKEAQWGKPVIITRKGDHLPEGVGVLDIERGKMEKSAEFLWQTDDSVAVNSWCYVNNLDLKPASELIHELIDIVSKNGVLLLNVAPKSDGTIDEQQKHLLLEMGNWLKINGEAIYGTRPWLIHGEGPKLYDEGRGFTGPAAQFSARDIRYTRKGQMVYAVCLGWPEDKIITLESVSVKKSGPDATVRLLGYDKTLKYKINDYKQLVIELPELSENDRPCKYAYSIKLSGFELGVNPLRNAVTLLAENAVLEGSRIQLEKKDSRPNIGYWDNPNEKTHWLLKIPQAGKYSFTGEFAAGAGKTSLQLKIVHDVITFDVPAASSWTDAGFTNIGQMKFDAAGVYQVTLEPADVQTWKPVNLWQIRCFPVE